MCAHPVVAFYLSFLTFAVPVPTLALFVALLAAARWPFLLVSVFPTTFSMLVAALAAALPSASSFPTCPLVTCPCVVCLSPAPISVRAMLAPIPMLYVCVVLLPLDFCFPTVVLPMLLLVFWLLPLVTSLFVVYLLTLFTFLLPLRFFSSCSRFARSFLRRVLVLLLFLARHW